MNQTNATKVAKFTLDFEARFRTSITRVRQYPGDTYSQKMLRLLVWVLYYDYCLCSKDIAKYLRREKETIVNIVLETEQLIKTDKAFYAEILTSKDLAAKYNGGLN